jgi:hypothetical protein
MEWILSKKYFSDRINRICRIIFEIKNPLSPLNGICKDHTSICFASAAGRWCYSVSSGN